MLIHPHDTVLFQGDSITDCGRDRDQPDSLGAGYAMIAAAWFSATHPTHDVRFLNRGVSGDRTVNLQSRWEDDCLALEPTLVSIMIGVNNTWRRYDSGDPTPTEQFAEEYHGILTAVRDRLDARILLLDPFVLPVPEDRRAWREDLDPKLEVVRKLAREFDAHHLPLDDLFAEACIGSDPAYWAPDGVHPTPAGHAFIARAWLRAVGLPLT